jgi:uroporphyrinogen III methyltransferase/synthase
VTPAGDDRPDPSAVERPSTSEAEDPAPNGIKRALDGRRVLVTRPRAQASELVHLLEKAGAEVIVAPTIRIVPPENRQPLLDAATDSSRFDWIVFTSSNAVDAYAVALDDTGTHITAPARVCAVGARTAERLREHGLEVSLTPGEFRADALVDALLADGPVAGKRFLIPRADIGREVIADRLRAAGALVTDVIAYRTVAEDQTADMPDVRKLLADAALDAVTFTSGSAVRNFVQIHGEDSGRLLRSAVVAVIGPVTFAAAREFGITPAVQPETATAAAMVGALARYFAEPRI